MHTLQQLARALDTHTQHSYSMPLGANRHLDEYTYRVVQNAAEMLHRNLQINKWLSYMFFPIGVKFGF